MTAPSPPGRAECIELLRLGDPVDNALVTADQPHATVALAVTTFIVRARRLVRASIVLLDRGFDLEAAVLGRALMDTAVTLAWLGEDLPERIRRWQLDDARTRRTWLTELAELDKDELAVDWWPELPDERGELQELIAHLEAEGVKGMPGFKARAERMHPSFHATAYRQGSHGAVHPSPYALESFIDHHDEAGDHVSAYGPRTRDKTYPYETAALWLHLAMDTAAMTSPAFPWTRADLQPPLDSIKAGIDLRSAGGPTG